MKREVWLKSNRRAMAFGLILPAAVALSGWSLIAYSEADTRLLDWLGWGLIVLGALMCGTLIHLMRMPRLAYDSGSLLVFLESGVPRRVPIELVEVFFLGQDAGTMGMPRADEVEVATIVVRLAERAEEWHDRDVKRALGRWCDGYIIINGTWCEPIQRELMERMNKRLVEVHRELRKTERTNT